MEAYEGDRDYIFVSYAHKDGEKALDFINELQQYCNVWYDDGIHAGNEWSDKIADKLLGCSLFLFLVSENSLASDNCRDELALARDSGKPFINVRLSDVPFTGGMRLRYGRYQTFDLFSYETVRDAVKALMKSESLKAAAGKLSVLKSLIANTRDMMTSLEDKNISEKGADLSSRFGIVGTPAEFGEYCGSPIKWEVKSVKDGKALLVAKDMIDAMAFDDDGCAYDQSTIRQWLNGEFYSSAFDDHEKSVMTTFEQLGDKVSLLSREQAIELFPSDGDRIKRGSQVAMKKGLWTNQAGYGWWWLCSSDAKADRIYRVYSNGRIGFDDDFDNKSVGVVPAIILDIR